MSKRGGSNTGRNIGRARGDDSVAEAAEAVGITKDEAIRAARELAEQKKKEGQEK